MAEFNSYLLGRVRKSVGNITLCYTRRKNIAKAKVFTRKDNPTPEILQQRAKVQLLGKMGRYLLPVIRKGFVGVGEGTTSNAFVSVNMPEVTVDAEMKATLDFTRLKVASGYLYTPKVTASYDAESSIYTFTQSEQQPEDGFCASNDKVYAVLLESKLLRVRLVTLKTRGESGSTTATLPEEWNNDNVHIYSFAMTKNERSTSDSIHIVY